MMVTFDSEEIKKHIAIKRLFSVLSTVAFIIAFCCGLFSAVAVGSMKEQAELITASWIIAVVAAVCFIAFISVLLIADKGVSKCVAKVLATAMEDNSELYTNESEIALIVEYEGNKVTLYRQNPLKKIVFDLSGIEKSVRAYSFFGAWILQYLEAYYYLHGNEGYVNVSISDYFDRRNDKFDIYAIIENGKVDVYRPEKNYFLKRGLIK
ncbi:MAG: hypothetical protein ACI4MN_05695 [Candidatus Coproplasma sp.]